MHYKPNVPKCLLFYCFYPQCLPITSNTNVLWWLRENRSQVRIDVGSLTRETGPFLSPLSGCHDCIHHLDDPVQSRIRADRHVGATEVVVDGADHPHYVQG